MAFYRLASKDALNDFSLASNAPPPVNGHQAFLSSAYEFFGLLFSTRFARCLKLKLFLRDASTGIAGGFRNNKKSTVILVESRWTYGGEMGIRTPDTVVAVYTISNRAPSTSSDISPFIRSNTKNKY